MPLSAKSAINMHLGIGGIITKLGIEKRRNVKHAFKFMTPMVWLTRLLVGAYPQWIGCKPEKIQRIYFANHSSHLDTIVIWSALPRSLRPLTRPVAARDYWQSGIRRRIAVDELNVVLVDRRRTENSDPLDPMRQALREKTGGSRAVHHYLSGRHALSPAASRAVQERYLAFDERISRS